MLTIHRASAGSGKTFTLAYEYIKLLLGEKVGEKDDKGVYHLRTHANGAHRSILAITFTNKATGEMKHRIVKELAALSDPNGKSAYLDKLAAEFNVAPAKVQAAATDALQSLLNDFSNFNVSTIDSFFQNILRTFAREAEVPYNYDIELQDKYAVKVGINDLLSSLNDKGGNHAQLIAWLKSYMRNQIDSDSSWDVFAEKKFGRGKSLHQLAENLGNETFKEYSDKLEMYLVNKTNITEFQKKLHDNIEANYEVIDKAAKDLQNYLGDIIDHISSKGGLSGFSKILKDGPRVELPAGFSSAIANPNKWFLKSKVKGFTSDPQIVDYINIVLDATYKNNTYKAIAENLYALGLLGDISSHVLKFRTENNLILLSDTNELLRRIINDDDTPFIYERVGLRLKHFLIDEFQDTSRMQWDNMKPLLSESLGTDNDNLIIGDEKQSIYRFRNADPSLLQTQVDDDFSSHIPTNTPLMDTNWRSSRNVIDFNNKLFLWLASECNCSSVYANNIRQNVSPKNQNNNGYVEVNFVEETESNTWKEQVLEELPKRIIDMLNRGLKQSDIAILVNTNDQGTKVIESLFQYNRNNPEGVNIKIVSDESLKLKNSPSVRLIVGMLKHINSTAAGTPKEQISTLLKEYEYALATAKAKDPDPSEALSHGIKTVQNPDNITATELTDIYSSSLISITEHIISKYIKVKTRKAENAYIQAFQDVIIDFSTRNTPTVHHFLKWWEGNKDMLTVTSPANNDAINVMTIHKSKGLEFASVIIPFTDWDMDSGRGFIWQEVKLPDGSDISTDIIPPVVPIDYKKSLAETKYKDEYEQISQANILDTLNKTYVAFTRAAQELLIFVPSEVKSGSISELLSGKFNGKRYILGELNTLYPQPQAVTQAAEVIEDYPVTEKLPNLHFKLSDTLIETPREHGILLHKIFSLIEYAKDIDSVVAQCVTNGAIKSEQQHEIRTFITTAINHSELTQSWFSADKRILMERSILTKSELKRPDRIVIDKSGNVTIIDYKFGTQHPKKYEKQLREYADLLHQAGFANVTSYLFYPNSAEVIPVC